MRSYIWAQEMPWLRLPHVTALAGSGSVAFALVVPVPIGNVAPVSQFGDHEIAAVVGVPQRDRAGRGAVRERGGRDGGEHEGVMVGVVAAVDVVEVAHLQPQPVGGRGGAGVGVAVEVQLDHPEHQVVRVLRADRDREVVVALSLAGHHGVRGEGGERPRVRRAGVGVVAAGDAVEAAGGVGEGDEHAWGGEPRLAAGEHGDLAVTRRDGGTRRDRHGRADRDQRVGAGGERAGERRNGGVEVGHVGVVGVVDAHEQGAVDGRWTGDHRAARDDEQPQGAADGEEGDVGERPPCAELVPRLAVVGGAVEAVLGGRPARPDVRRMGGEGVDPGVDDRLAGVRPGPVLAVVGAAQHAGAGDAGRSAGGHLAGRRPDDRRRGRRPPQAHSEIAPIDSDGSSCHSGNQESPPSSDLKTPPDAGPAYMICGRLGSIASARTRPPTLRGPIGTQLCWPRTAARGASAGGGGCSVSASPGRRTFTPSVGASARSLSSIGASMRNDSSANVSLGVATGSDGAARRLLMRAGRGGSGCRW